MLFKKFWQKFSQNTALATPSPSLFNCVCHDVTPYPLPKAFYPPPNGQVLLHVWYAVCCKLEAAFQTRIFLLFITIRMNIVLGF